MEIPVAQSNSRDFGIPALLPDKLATVGPEHTYAGGPMLDASTQLCVWRTCRFPATARGSVLGFFVDDYRFECLWQHPERYAAQFAHFGWGALVEPDFSTWVDAPLAEQLWAIYRMRTLGKLYQEYGLKVIPNLAWADERSFEFCFAGIPVGAPVVACECRTAGQTDGNRRAFLAGLAEAVRQVAPAQVVIYGGVEHQYWLVPHLPTGPQYTLLEAWTRARGRVRRDEERRLRHRNQIALIFPTKGTDTWADEAPVAAVAAEPA